MYSKTTYEIPCFKCLSFLTNFNKFYWYLNWYKKTKFKTSKNILKTIGV